MGFLLIATCSIAFGQSEAPTTPVAGVPVLERMPDKFFNLEPNTPARIDGFLSDLFLSTGMRGGIVYARGENITVENSLIKPSGLAVREILDLFAVSTGYAWNEKAGIVNIFPKESYSLFNIRIKAFRINKATPHQFRAALLALPEFNDYLRKNGLIGRVPDAANLHGYICCGFIGKTPNEDLISIDVRDVTFREILDEAVRQGRSDSYWTYTEYKVESSGRTYKLFRLGGFLSGTMELSE